MKLAEHNIPIGSMVEINMEYHGDHGARLWVADHTRNCDGMPLYALYGSSNINIYEYVKEENPPLARYLISDGWTSDCLIFLKEPDIES